MSDACRVSVHQVPQSSFASTFAILMWIAAAACAISAVVAYFVIDDRELKMSRGEDIEDESDIPPDQEASEFAVSSEAP